MDASVRDIYLRPAARAPVRRVERASAVEGRGLVDDHADGGERQLTVLSLDAWRDACTELGVDVDPAARRANIAVSGVDLAESRGRRLALGPVVVEVRGELRPCELLDDACPGLFRALRADWRAGVYCRIVRGGTVGVGDPVRWIEAGGGASLAAGADD